jgi:hypothetical protein
MGTQRKAKREPSPFCPDPRQLDFWGWIHEAEKREGFQKLDEAIRKVMVADHAVIPRSGGLA